MLLVTRTHCIILTMSSRYEKGLCSSPTEPIYGNRATMSGYYDDGQSWKDIDFFEPEP